MTERGTPPSPGSDLIEVVFEQRSVALLVRAPGEGQPAATPEDAIAALRRGPFATVPAQKVNSIVGARSGEPVPIGQVPVPPDAVGCFVAVSPDGLAAYLVPAPVPPAVATDASEDDPAPPTVARTATSDVAERLRERGVTHGILDELLASFDPPRELESIECIARGTPPIEGRDAHIELGLNDAHYAPVVLPDGTVDHHATLAARFVEQGAVIAMRVPPVAGTPGMTVTGERLDPRPVLDQLLDTLVGDGTELQGDLLIATSPGRPVRSGDRIDVLPSFEVPGDLDYSVGNIEFAGDVVVVKAGFSIVATGSVVVRGMLEHATIRAGRDISLQGAVGLHEHDRHEKHDKHEKHDRHPADKHDHDPPAPEQAPAALEAGGDIDAMYLHSITVRAAGEVRAKREIVNCEVRAAKVLTGSRGRIVGGEVTASAEISAGSLGSHQGTRTLLHITEHRSDEALVIRAGDAVHAGVRLNVGGAIFDLEDDLPGSSFWQLGGEVVRLDPLATLPDVVAFAEETGRRPPLPALEAHEAEPAEDRPAA